MLDSIGRVLVPSTWTCAICRGPLVTDVPSGRKMSIVSVDALGGVSAGTNMFALNSRRTGTGCAAVHDVVVGSKTESVRCATCDCASVMADIPCGGYSCTKKKLGEILSDADCGHNNGSGINGDGVATGNALAVTITLSKFTIVVAGSLTLRNKAAYECNPAFTEGSTIEIVIGRLNVEPVARRVTSVCKSFVSDTVPSRTIVKASSNTALVDGNVTTRLTVTFTGPCWLTHKDVPNGMLWPTASDVTFVPSGGNSCSTAKLSGATIRLLLFK